jgi:hypothetical protein
LFDKFPALEKRMVNNDFKGRLCFVQFAVGEEREDDKLDYVIVLLSNVNKYFYRDFFLLIKD